MPGRQRPPEGRDDAGGDRALEPVRVADRDDELADSQALGVAELGGDEVSVGGADDGEVGERVGAHGLEAELAAVGEPGAAAGVGAGDDMGGGEDEAVVAEDDPAAGAGSDPAAAGAALDPQARHRGGERGRHGRDGARVGVERFVIRGVVRHRRALAARGGPIDQP